MNYLELVQATCRETGTIPEPRIPSTLATVTDQRLKLIMSYVNRSYASIQNAHRMWRWMQGQFYGNTTPGVGKYAGTYFTDEDTGLPIVRFSQWGFPMENGSDTSLYSYLTSGGVAVEGPLRWLEWDDFYSRLRGSQDTTLVPHFYAVDPQNNLRISPIPTDVYTLHGKYRRGNQTLAVDADIPEMPAEFHSIIIEGALIYIEGFDEGQRIPVIRLRQLPDWNMLEQQQLPKMTWGRPLA